MFKYDSCNLKTSLCIETTLPRPKNKTKMMQQWGLLHMQHTIDFLTSTEFFSLLILIVILILILIGLGKFALS